MFLSTKENRNIIQVAVINFDVVHLLELNSVILNEIWFLGANKTRRGISSVRKFKEPSPRLCYKSGVVCEGDIVDCDILREIYNRWPCVL